MRTTIQLTKEQRTELLRLASKRGLKDFSSLIQEAINEYLQNQAKKLHLIEAALNMQGVLQDKSGEDFEKSIQAVRSTWRS